MKAAATAQDVRSVVKETIKICAIPAPTFAEEKRAAYIFKRMKEIGLANVRRDFAGNVIGELGDTKSRARLLVSAHLDTVFPPSTALRPFARRRRVYGPGIGDNSVALAALLWLAGTLKKNGYPKQGKVLFAANPGEEGLGNLNGMRALIKTYGRELDFVLPIEGHFRDTPSNVGVMSVRLKVQITARGGHSWHNFGESSAVHVLGSIIARISAIKVPKKPKTTFNVGLVSGGRSVNTIAADAQMIIDLRSVDNDALSLLERTVRKCIRQECGEGVKAIIEVAGRRPGGTLPLPHPLCRVYNAARKTLGLKKANFVPASTDANIPLSEGIPALAVGVTTGEFMHSENEYIDIKPIAAGLDLLLLQTLGTLELP